MLRYVIFIIIFSTEYFYANDFDTQADSLKIYSADTLLMPTINQEFLLKLVGSKEEFEYENMKIEILNINDSVPLQVIQDSVYGIEDYSFFDINFDGLLDIQVNKPSTISGVNFPSDFWFYDSSSNKFLKSEEFSGLNNVTVDENKKEIQCEWNWAGRQVSHSTTFKVVEGHLKVIEEDEYERGNKEHKILVNDSLITDFQTIIVEGKDETGNWVIKETNKELVYGELEIIRILKKNNYNEVAPTIEQINSGIVFEDFSGRYIIIREDLFSYRKDVDNKRIVQIKTRKVVDNKWEIEYKIIDYEKFKNSN